MESNTMEESNKTFELNKTLEPEKQEYIGMMSLAECMIQHAKLCNSNNKFVTIKFNLFSAFEMGHKDGYYYLGMHYKKRGTYHKMKTCFLQNIEKYECDESMVEMGLYYDDIEFYDKMFQYYLMASKYNNVSAIYNLSQYYKSIEYDTEKMLHYIDAGIKLGDVDCVYELSIYYGTILEFDKMIEYYELAIEKDDGTCVNDGVKGFNLLYILKYLDANPNKSEKVKKKFEKLQKSSGNAYFTYKNKIQLFTKLQHIQECMICYETKLHIDIHCGHTFCTDCYCKIYKSPCPLCRY